VNPEEEKERLRWEGFAEKEGFKPEGKVQVRELSHAVLCGRDFL